MTMASRMQVTQDIKLVLCFVILDILALLSVILRFWGISIQRTKIRPHDILCVVALVSKASVDHVGDLSTYTRKYYR